MSGGDQVFPKIHLNTGSARKRRRAERWSSRRTGRVSTERHDDWWQRSPKRFFLSIEGDLHFMVITCELAIKSTQQLYKVSTPCFDNHHFKEEELKSVGELSKVCSQIVLKCLYLARIGRPDILWSVNKLARAVTKWTKAYDKRSARLISYIHYTCEYRQ